MADSAAEVKLPDPAEISGMAQIAEKSQRLVTDFLQRQGGGGNGGVGMANPLAIGAAFFEMTARMMSDPARLVAGADLAVERLHAAVADRAQRLLGEPAEPVVEPAADDRRFNDPAGATTRSSTSSSSATC